MLPQAETRRKDRKRSSVAFGLRCAPAIRSRSASNIWALEEAKIAAVSLQKKDFEPARFVSPSVGRMWIGRETVLLAASGVALM